MSGLEVARGLRRQYGSARRLVAYSGHDTPFYQQQTESLGFATFLAKPASAPQLLAALKSAVI